MQKPFKSVIGVLSLVWFTAAAAQAWEIPLTVENQARAGVPPFISGGVPLLAGQAKETSDLRLAVKDGAGKLAAIPAQFRVLARWWRGDNSIRWVLVDFASGNVPGEKKVVYLTDAKLDDATPKAALTIEDGPDAIVISTGPARFTVNKKKFNFLQSAVVDGEELLDSSADAGTVIEDTFGQKYYATEGTKDVAVIEKGPMRVCVRARGQHVARAGKGYSRGMYGYDVFMNFYAGSSDVCVDAVITNNFVKSIGSPVFKDASLLLLLAGGARGYGLWGDKPVEGKLPGGESVCLYQDSNGTDTWESCPGFGNMSKSGWSGLSTKITSFKGYKVLKRGAGKEQELAAGNQARGLLHGYNDRGGVIVHTLNFWQQFPKAAEVAGNGTVRIGLFPREFKVVHYLEDASAKGHEMVLHFYRAGGKSMYQSGPDGRPEPTAVAAAWDCRVHPRPDVKHMAETGALSDTGPFTVPADGMTEKPGDKIAVSGTRWLSGDGLYGNAAGWQVFGERWRSNGGHSEHGARQPIKEDVYLARWYVTGLPEWLALGEARTRQFRDVRSYRIDDQDALAFKNNGEFRKANTQENGWCARPVPKDEELKKYQEGFWARAPWEFPNPEHCTLDELYDRYLLFGDVRAFENMRIVAGNGGFFAIANAPGISRAQGWSWRALERYWDLTGDKRSEELLKDIMKVYSPLIDKKPLWSGDAAKPSIWFTQIFSRAVAVTALHTGDAKMLELCKAFADGKEERADYFCAVFAVAYHLTGEEKYKEAVMKKTNDGKRLLHVLDVDNFENQGKTSPTAVHWLLNQPPRIKK